MFLADERSGVCPARKNGALDVLGSQLAVLTEAEESEPTEVVAQRLLLAVLETWELHRRA